MCNVEFYPGMISFVPGAGKGFQKWSPPVRISYKIKLHGCLSSTGQHMYKTNSSRTNFIFFIGPESDHWLCLSVTNSLTYSLTHSCLVDLLAVNDTNCLMMSQQPLKAVKSFLRLKKLCKLSTAYKSCQTFAS